MHSATQEAELFCNIAAVISDVPLGAFYVGDRKASMLKGLENRYVA